MKNYYIHNGVENSGPFDLEELKEKKITKTTLVWFEGMDQWSHAGDIDELKNFFVVSPPPLINIPKAPKNNKKVKRKTILGLEKNYFYLAFVFVLLVIGTLVFNNYQENRSQDFEQKNRQTEFHNQQMEQQQKEVDEKKMQAIIQEKIEKEKIARERKEAINNRLLEIKITIDATNTILENNKIKLADAEGFKLLRSVNEKNEQISRIQNEIRLNQNEIKKLKNEADTLYLELENID
jgi:hypothetical protein